MGRITIKILAERVEVLEEELARHREKLKQMNSVLCFDSKKSKLLSKNQIIKE